MLFRSLVHGGSSDSAVAAEEPVVIGKTKEQSIKFCLDNDEPGRKATDTLMEKYYGLGYDVEDRPPPKAYKDYNKWLKEARKEMALIGWEKEMAR